MAVHFRSYVERTDVPAQPRLSEALHWIGWAEEQQGRPEAALGIYLAVLDRFGNDPSAGEVGATLQALEQALRLGMDYEITLHTPLRFRSKADTVRLARDLGALPALADTHTCYHGQQPPCGECPACVLRARGFAEAGIPDPLVERFREMTL